MSCKKSSLVWCEILRLFVNAWTADDNYSGSNMQRLAKQFQTSLSEKKKNFSDFLLHFWNVHKIQSIFKKRMIILAQRLPKLLMLKDVAS